MSLRIIFVLASIGLAAASYLWPILLGISVITLAVSTLVSGDARQ